MTQQDLFEAILMARERVYAVGSVTPLEEIKSDVFSDISVWVKREDQGPIKAYKWRGAYNAMASLNPQQRENGVVTASAGNHAQGVALAAKALGCQATIFMPRSTPEVKRREVARHGEEMVEIRLVGDSFDEAALAAGQFCKKQGGIFVHPYNDLETMGGQGTLADEVVMSGNGPFDRVYVSVGGGGLASSVACWLKAFWPHCQVFGVEGEDQASMKAAFQAGQPVELDYLDVFCDATAVRKVGERTFSICKDLLDGIVTVSNEEVCEGIRMMWESVRVIPEPSGAMGLAAVKKDYLAGKIAPQERVLTILCGANMDFAQLGNIARQASITGGNHHVRKLFRVEIPQGRGTLVRFLKSLPEEISIVDLQHGMVEGEKQSAVIGLLGQKADFQRLDHSLDQGGVEREEILGEEIVNFRIINYSVECFSHPLFVKVEFPERPGAFLAFMEEVKDVASLCYFNYSYSGERVGRALVGIDFETEEQRTQGLSFLNQLVDKTIRAVKPVSEDTVYGLLGHSQ